MLCLNACSQKEHLPDSEILVPFHIMECAVPFVLHELHTTSGSWGSGFHIVVVVVDRFSSGMVLGYGFILVCKVILSSCMIDYDNKVGYAIHHAFYLICGRIHNPLWGWCPIRAITTKSTCHLTSAVDNTCATGPRLRFEMMAAY